MNNHFWSCSLGGFLENGITCLKKWIFLGFLIHFASVTALCFSPGPCQSLESVLRHPADNRTQIRELGQTLIDGGILDDIISEKLEAFNSRYDELSHLVSTGTGMSVVSVCNMEQPSRTFTKGRS